MYSCGFITFGKLFICFWHDIVILHQKIAYRIRINRNSFKIRREKMHLFIKAKKENYPVVFITLPKTVPQG